MRSLGSVLIDIEQRPPHVTPHEIAGRTAEVLGLAPRHGYALGDKVAHDLGDEPRLASTGLGGDCDNATGTAENIVEGLCEHCHLGFASDHR